MFRNYCSYEVIEDIKTVKTSLQYKIGTKFFAAKSRVKRYRSTRQSISTVG